MGTMQAIRDLLSGGMTVVEVIEAGYAPSSTYKAAKQLEGNGQAKRRQPSRITLAQPSRRRIFAATPQPTNSDNREGLETELALLREEAEQAKRLRAQVGELQAWAQHLEQEAQQVASLHVRIASLEGEAQEAAQLRQRVKDLEAQLQQATEGQAEMHQAAIVRQWDFDEMKAAKVKAEQQWGIWSGSAQRLEEENKALKVTVAELEPLRVWAGHPCKVRGKPMPGVVSREDAAHAMEPFYHSDCVVVEAQPVEKPEQRKEGPGLGTIAIGAGLLYVLSQAGKARR